jgi:hypothetical protein
MITHVVVTQPLVEIGPCVPLASRQAIELSDNSLLERLHVRNAAYGTALVHVVGTVAKDLHRPVKAKSS